MRVKIFIICIIFSFTAVSAVKPHRKVESFGVSDQLHKNLLMLYKKDHKNKKDLASLQKKTLALKGKAVPVLIKVMKSGKYPGKNRWIATFLLGKIMGKKSGPFIAKFLEHPSWILRMASLKTLLALSERKYGRQYSELLHDKSMIVRAQALDNIQKLNLVKFAPNVWAMLFDKKNYHKSKKKTKRAHIVKTIIKTIGKLKFKKAKKPLFSMIQKAKYKDIYEEIDYSLQEITGRKSPKVNMDLKQRFWKRVALSEMTI
jgi:hypothetical protein